MEHEYKYDVFLSFSTKDRDSARSIWEKLTKSGLKVFFSDETLKGGIGTPFDDFIQDALLLSKNFVLVCTPNAMQSDEVEEEYKTFYHEIHKPDRKQRRFIILEEQGFDISLLPLNMRRLQTASSVDDIVKIIAGHEIQKAPKKEEKIIPQKTKVPLKAKKTPKSKKFKIFVQNRKKIIKWVSMAMIPIVLIAAVFIIINFKSETFHLKPIDLEKTNKTATFIFLRHKISKLEDRKLSSQQPKQKIYVTHLSFIDARTQSTMAQTEVRDLIDEAVIRGMNMGKKSNDYLEINAFGHEIPNNDAHVNQLINIVYDPTLTTSYKVDQIINKLMNPYKIDVIVSGQYIDDAKNPMILIRPFAIVKAREKIITRNLQFTRDELLCQDPNSKKNMLCRGAYDQISQAVKELLDEI